MSKKTITIELISPPIATPNFDYRAYWGDYEPDDIVGYGATEYCAVLDLLRLMEESE